MYRQEDSREGGDFIFFFGGGGKGGGGGGMEAIKRVTGSANHLRLEIF